MNEGEEEQAVEDRDSFGWSADSIQQWKMEMENTLMLILVLKECLMFNGQNTIQMFYRLYFSNKVAKCASSKKNTVFIVSFLQHV